MWAKVCFHRVISVEVLLFWGVLRYSVSEQGDDYGYMPSIVDVNSKVPESTPAIWRNVIPRRHPRCHLVFVGMNPPV